MPFPRVVPRDVEFMEHAGEIDEWKPQLAAAILCGVFGIAGVFFNRAVQNHLSTSRPVWPAGFIRRRKSGNGCKSATIDVHFLMLVVAAGAASIGAWGEGATLLFLFSFSGALEHYALGPHAKGNPLALPRRAQDRHRAG